MRSILLALAVISSPWESVYRDAAPFSTAGGTLSGDVALSGNQLSGYVGSVANKTANYALLSTDCSGTFTNSGAVAEVDFTLPATAVGCVYTFDVAATQILKVIANTGDTIRVSATVSGAAGNIQSTTIGDVFEMVQTSASTWVIKSLVTTNAGTVSVN